MSTNSFFFFILVGTGSSLLGTHFQLCTAEQVMYCRCNQMKLALLVLTSDSMLSWTLCFARTSTELTPSCTCTPFICSSPIIASRITLALTLISRLLQRPSKAAHSQGSRTANLICVDVNEKCLFYLFFNKYSRLLSTWLLATTEFVLFSFFFSMELMFTPRTRGERYNEDLLEHLKVSNITDS